MGSIVRRVLQIKCEMCAESWACATFLRASAGWAPPARHFGHCTFRAGGGPEKPPSGDKVTRVWSWWRRNLGRGAKNPKWKNPFRVSFHVAHRDLDEIARNARTIAAQNPVGVSHTGWKFGKFGHKGAAKWNASSTGGYATRASLPSAALSLCVAYTALQGIVSSTRTPHEAVCIEMRQAVQRWLPGENADAKSCKPHTFKTCKVCRLSASVFCWYWMKMRTFSGSFITRVLTNWKCHFPFLTWSV